MSFSKSLVEFSKTHALPKITADYISNNEDRKSLDGTKYAIDSFRDIIAKRASLPVNRALLVDVLKEQNSDASALVLKNIDALQKANTFTVTTGHQLNIFTGPLYFIYKIISTVKLSQTLNKKFPTYQFVPVYWMNGEDHDIEEINHTYLYGKRVEWKTIQKGAAGKMSTKGISELINEIELTFGDSENAKKLVSVLKVAYHESNTLSKAMRVLCNALFEKHGLVILDADDARLKKEFVPVMKDDMINHTAYQKVNETIKEVEKDYEVQVRPREINLFYFAENSRERIVKENSVWKVLNTSIEWKQDGLMKEVEQHPERFSPNVVLRPLYQELILPNVAYIGGPAEIAYWLEYKRMFDHYKISYPLPVLRECAMIIEDASASKLSKLGFATELLFNSTEELAKDYVRRSSDNFSMSEEAKQIADAFDLLVKRISEVDASLATSAEAEKQKQLNGLNALEGKVMRAQKKKHETAIQQIQKIKDKFFPNGSLQERIDNFMPYYIKYGDVFFDQLLHQFEPMGGSFLILTEEKT